MSRCYRDTLTLWRVEKKTATGDQLAAVTRFYQRARALLEGADGVKLQEGEC